MKILPPTIEGVLPAFVGNTISIPFEHNITVGKNYSGFSVRVSTLISNTLIGVFQGQENNGAITIDTNGSLNGKGELFAIQVAYIGTDGTVGYYSNTATVRKIPHAEARGRIELVNNAEIVGYFYFTNQIGGTSVITDEVPISYYFTVYDNGNKLFEESKEQIHNVNSVDNNEFIDKYLLKRELLSSKNYDVYYTITTINGYTKTFHSKISSLPDIESDINAELVAELNYDNGYVDLSLDTQATALTGTFVISRTSSESDYIDWVRLFEFSLQSEIPKENKIWKDFTVKQGITYVYSLQQKNDYNIFSSRKKTGEIMVDFEDMFLYDGERQLKIQFNPKVTSLKRNTPETKTDTIGGRYPFFFRNGNINYKEFPISGLITYNMDEAHLFNNRDYFTEQSWQQLAHFSKEEGVKAYNPSFDAQTPYDLSGYNIAAEREFKIEVLEWLTNGKPKLFRSPSEGNFLVRLMNVSLSPNDQLGRMLHTFNATAYEIGEPTFTELRKYGVSPSLETEKVIEATKTMLFKSFDCNSTSAAFQLPLSISEDGKQKQLMVKYIKLIDVQPTSAIEITYDTGKQIKIIVGASGIYEKFFKEETITKIIVRAPTNSTGLFTTGQLTIGYYEDVKSEFNTITQIKKGVVPLQQFNIQHLKYNNLVAEIEDSGKNLESIYRLHATVDKDLSLYKQAEYYSSPKYFYIGKTGTTEHPEAGQKILQCLQEPFGAVAFKLKMQIDELNRDSALLSKLENNKFTLECVYQYPEEEHIIQNNQIQLQNFRNLNRSYFSIYRVENNTVISSNKWSLNNKGLVTFNLADSEGMKVKLTPAGRVKIGTSETFDFKKMNIGDIFEPEFILTADNCNLNFDLDKVINFSNIIMIYFNPNQSAPHNHLNGRVLGYAINEEISTLRIEDELIDLSIAQDYTATHLSPVKLLRAGPDVTVELTYDYTERVREGTT